MLDVEAIRNLYFTSRLTRVTPEELRAITSEQMAESGFYQRMLETVVDPMYTYEIGKTAEMHVALRQALERAKAPAVREGDLWQQYQELLVYLQWNCLPLLSAVDVERLFQFHIIFCHRAEIEIVEKVYRLYMDYLDQPAEYKRFRDAALRGFKANQERLGSSPLTMERTSMPSALSNWLRDYDNASITRAQQRDLSRVTYLNQNRNVKPLTPKEREILRRILKAYDLLKYPFLAAGTITATGHGVPPEPLASVFPSEREFSSISPPSGEVTQERVITAYRGAVDIQQAVEQAIEKLRQSAGDPRVLRREFFRAVRERAIPKTVAVLRLLCERDELLPMISGDEQLKRYLAAVWPEMYGQAAAEELRQDPNSRQSVQKFLQYVLQERLGLPAGEAARIGAQLGNVFKQRGQNELQTLAYFDVRDQTFKWLA